MGLSRNMIIEAWQKKGHPNMHIVFYEDMKENIDGELKKLNEFLETGLSKEQLDNVS